MTSGDMPRISGAANPVAEQIQSIVAGSCVPIIFLADSGDSYTGATATFNFRGPKGQNNTRFSLSGVIASDGLSAIYQIQPGDLSKFISGEYAVSVTLSNFPDTTRHPITTSPVTLIVIDTV